MDTFRFSESESESEKAAQDPKVYETAADLIEQRKWIRWELHNDAQGAPVEKEYAYEKGASFCILGALEASAYHLGYAAANWWLMNEPATEIMGLPRPANFWNNQIARSKEEVVVALRRGAQRLKGSS